MSVSDCCLVHYTFLPLCTLFFTYIIIIGIIRAIAVIAILWLCHRVMPTAESNNKKRKEMHYMGDANPA